MLTIIRVNKRMFAQLIHFFFHDHVQQTFITICRLQVFAEIKLSSPFVGVWGSNSQYIELSCVALFRSVLKCSAFMAALQLIPSCPTLCWRNSVPFDQHSSLEISCSTGETFSSLFTGKHVNPCCKCPLVSCQYPECRTYVMVSKL